MGWERSGRVQVPQLAVGAVGEDDAQAPYRVFVDVEMDGGHAVLRRA